MHPVERQAVAQEAISWLGTPYHPHAGIKGVGVDCGHLLIEVYGDVLGMAKPDPGFYAVDWHLHHGEELFLGWIVKYCDQVDAPSIGDVGNSFGTSAG